MIYLQSPTMSYHCGPDILMRQTLAHLPALSQEADPAIATDLPHDVHSTRCDRQLRRQGTDLLLEQSHPPDAPLHLCRSQTLKRRRFVLVSVPVQEQSLLADYLLCTTKMIAFPKLTDPQPIDSLNQRVAFGLAGRQEDRLDPKVQAQSHNCSEAAWCALAAVEGSIVVQLQAVRQPQLLPRFQQMPADRGNRFIAADRLRQGARLGIHAMKDKELFSTFEIAGEPIRRVQHEVWHPVRLWTINLHWLRRVGVCQTSLFQPSLGRRQRRHCPEQSLTDDLLPHCMRTQQADPASFEGGTDSNHDRVSLRGIALRGSGRTARELLQTEPAELCESLRPFAQPLTSTRDALEHVTRAQTLEHQTNDFASPTEFFVNLFHTASLGGSMESSNAHDVVSLFSIRLPTMS